MTDDSCRFAHRYRGRHAPEDALWWLDHPESDGPTGAAPPQRMFLDAADELRSRGMDDAAEALLQVLADLLQSDRRATLDALAIDDEEHGGDEPRER